MYARLEEDHGLARHAMALYDRATKAVLPAEQFEVRNVFSLFSIIILWPNLFSGHGARWLVAEMSEKKKRIALPGAVRGQNAFLRTCKFWRENFRVDLNENKKGLGNVRCKSSNNNTSWNIGVAFLESCLSISEANECITSVNVKRNQETQR